VRANNSSSSTNSDRSVECTSSVIQALNMFREMYPGYRKEEIEKCIKTASRFIEKEKKTMAHGVLHHPHLFIHKLFKFWTYEIIDCITYILTGLALGVYVSFTGHYMQ
jgi:hypothetical protein